MSEPTNNLKERALPLLIFDGACAFCRLWVHHWRRETGGRVAFAKSQDVGSDYPAIKPEAFEKAVQLVEPDGTITSGAGAAFRVLTYAPGRGWLYSLYRYLPGFRLISESIYRVIASNRSTAYHATRLLWGKNIGPHGQSLTTWLFLRLLGVVTLSAFVSLHGQILGLVGSRGILPVGDFLTVAKERFGGQAYTQFPTLAWLNHSDSALLAMCTGGIFLSLLLILNIAPLFAVIGLWVLYLSVTVAGQIFLGYQWDALLIETTFLAIFVAPGTLLPGQQRRSPPPNVVIFLFRFLLFRLMFGSGLVKLASGDPNWRDLTALSYHFQSQPLPTPLAYYAHQLPLWATKLGVVSMFFIEMIVPFTYFMPRRVRFAGAALTVMLQAGIMATGNFTFFNLLSALLAVFLLDDTLLARMFPATLREQLTRYTALPAQRQPAVRIAYGALALTLIGAGSVQLVQALIKVERIPVPVNQVLSWLSPLRIVNPYGLFAVMTTEHDEIVVEGSNDGENWQAYRFRWKPDELGRPLLWVAPHQPRLDWQMWFASLGSYRSNPWFVAFLEKLLEGSPEVTGLLRHNPFPDQPPRYLRAGIFRYTMTSPEERAATGRIWSREPLGLYFPVIERSEITP